MKIKTAVIGLGRAGSQYDEGKIVSTPRSHVGALLQSRDFELAAVCETSEKHRSDFFSDWTVDVPAFPQVSQLLRSGHFDVVTVATPPAEQYEMLKEIVSCRPRVIFCEKPFCQTSKDASDICRLAASAGVNIVVNYQRRWDERIRAVADCFKEMGRPSRFEVQYSKGLLNYGSHMLNLLEFFFGKIAEVTNAFAADDQRSLADPSISGRIRLESGLEGTLLGIDHLNYELFDLSVYYPAAKFVLLAGGYEVKKFAVQEGVYYPGYRHLAAPEQMFEPGAITGLLAAYDEIRRFLENPSVPLTNTGESAARLHFTMEEMRRLAGQGGTTQ